MRAPRRGGWGRAGGAAVAAAALAVGPSPAAAELDDEALRLERAWRAAGFEVKRGAPLFLEQGATRLLPAGLWRAAGPGREEGAGACATVAALAVRGADFSVTLPTDLLPSGRPAGRRAERALAGLVTLTRCGAERQELAHAAVEMRSPRGAVEVLVAEGAGPPPPARDTLLERSVPLPRALVDPGRARTSEGLDARLRWAEERARRDGAAASERREIDPSDDGAGRALVPLSAGCHRLELFAAQGPNESVADVDADVRDAATNRMLARDRSDTPDAHLEACVGEATTALVRFSGAPGRAPLTLLDARWPLPKGLPEAAPARARAGMARALAARRVPDPGGPPLATLLGASGATHAHLELEPGGCYVAAVAVAQGEARSLGLAVRGPGFVAGDDALHGADGASAAFCARHPGRAQVTVEARGSGFAWMLALWQVASAPPKGVSP
ncbi:MAG TPA: hypothetical protein VFS43_35850 [Polyangiaceae bacterium]|nr:hypothetical protein [Polyangiaceae bacterium]